MRELFAEALPRLFERPRLVRLLAVLDGGGEETRIVGGSVRNALIGRPVSDFDCATTALPDEVMRRASAAGFKAVPTGFDHGTVTVVVEGEPFEVTTLREDVETDGRHAVVRFGRDFAADARRRDFTINALSLGADGRLHDYAGGVDDLSAGRVRFIGDPVARIREDFLRILRFFRFHAGYAEGSPDAAGLAAAARERAGLGLLSPERVRAEFLKLVTARRAAETLDVMAGQGLLLPILCGVAEFGRFARAAAAGQDAVARLAALAVLTAEDAERLRERWRLSNDEHLRLADHARLVARLKDRAEPLDALAIRRLVADEDPHVLAEALAALAGEPRPVLAAGAAAALEGYRSGAEPVPVFPLRGRDFLAAGLRKGREIGERLAFARARWIAEGCPTDEDSARSLLERAVAQTAPTRL